MARLLVSKQAFERKTVQPKQATKKDSVREKKSYVASTASLSRSLSCSNVSIGANEKGVGWVALENVLKNRVNGKYHRGRRASHAVRPLVPIQHVHIISPKHTEDATLKAGNGRESPNSNSRNTNSRNIQSRSGLHPKAKPVATAATRTKGSLTAKSRPKKTLMKRKKSLSKLLGLNSLSGDWDLNSFDAVSLTIVNLAANMKHKATSDSQKPSKLPNELIARKQRNEGKKSRKRSTETESHNTRKEIVQKEHGSKEDVIKHQETTKTRRDKYTVYRMNRLDEKNFEVSSAVEDTSEATGPLSEADSLLLDSKGLSRTRTENVPSALEVPQWLPDSSILCLSGSNRSLQCLPRTDEYPSRHSNDRAPFRLYASTSSLPHSERFDKYAALEEDGESLFTKHSNLSDDFVSSDSVVTFCSETVESEMNPVSDRGKGKLLKRAFKKTLGWLKTRTPKDKSSSTLSTSLIVENDSINQTKQETQSSKTKTQSTPKKSECETKGTSEAVQRAWLQELQSAIKMAKEKGELGSSVTDDESDLTEGSSIILSETDEEYGYEFVPTDERLQAYAARHLKDLDDASVSSLELLYNWITCSKVETKGIDPNDMIIEVMSSFEDSTGRPIRRFRMRYSPAL